MAQIFVSPFAQYTDGSGNPGSGDLLHFYTVGTTTAITIYSDVGLTTPQANPVVADSAGQWPAVYLAEQLYKVVMKSAAGVTIRTADPAGGDGVTGATSSTDNAVPRWDGVSGHKLQNSGVIIDDSNNVTGVAALTATSLLGAGRPPTVQVFSTPGAFTYTPTPGTKYADFEGVGGGGAGGNVDGQGVNSGGAGGGGASGYYGHTGPIDITGAANFAGVIGIAGVVNASPSGDGSGGGSTSMVVGATTYTWGGGSGGGGMIAANGYGSQDGGAPGVGTNVIGSSQPGGLGVWSGTDTNATGGNGASSPLGSGGKGQHIIVASAANALSAAGVGAGGGGGCVTNVATNAVGTAGKAGCIRVWEYY